MKQIYHYVFLLIIVLISSCNKELTTKHWEAQIIKNKANSLPELFNQIGSEKLVEIVSSKDQVQVSAYNKMKANQIASYFIDKYKIDIREEFKDNPEGIIVLGMLYAAKEYEDARIKIKGNSLEVMKSPEEEMNCFFVAVESVIGITQARSLWKSIAMGATKEAVISSVSLLSRRVVAIWSVANLVYDIGGCLEWW
jgi:hypothetical protein